MFRRAFAPVLAIGAFGLVVTISAASPAQNPAPGSGQAAGVTIWVPHTLPAEKIDTDAIAKIRTEGMEHSKIMWIEHNLADVYGPRPIGPPNHVAAANWAVKTMTSWGMQNAHLEPFTWRGVGWLPGRASGFTEPPFVLSGSRHGTAGQEARTVPRHDQRGHERTPEGNEGK